MFILGSTKAFGQLVTIYDIPETILNLFQVLANHPEIVMLLIGIFYIFIGMWLESVAQIVIFTAVFLPLAVKLGIDPVVFGIFTVLTCEIGFLTPPIGINLICSSPYNWRLNRKNIYWSITSPNTLCSNGFNFSLFF